MVVSKTQIVRQTVYVMVVFHKICRQIQLIIQKSNQLRTLSLLLNLPLGSEIEPWRGIELFRVKLAIFLQASGLLRSRWRLTLHGLYTRSKPTSLEGDASYCANWSIAGAMLKYRVISPKTRCGESSFCKQTHVRYTMWWSCRVPGRLADLVLIFNKFELFERANWNC